MYIIFNKDGSVSESQLTDYINQHSDGVNYIDISIVGKSVDEYTADGNFKLPNNEVVSLTGSFTNKIKTSTGVYEGYRITLSSAVTEYQGDVALSIQVYNADKTTLFTYPVTLYVNETTGRGGDPITQDQYQALRAMMADYQLQYSRSNMRSYDTIAEATEDLPNLSEGQMVLAKETADSETSSVFQKVGNKLEGVSLDGLAVDKFLKKKNAEGEGSFAWYAKGEGAPVDFTLYSETLKQMQEVAGAEQFEPIFKFEGNYVGPAKLTLRSFNTSPKIELSGRSGSTPDTSAVFTLDGVSLSQGLIRWCNSSYGSVANETFLTSRLLGQRGGHGVASLDFDGKIPTSQLPSYVSDVLEFPTFDRFPTKGEVNKIYIALDTNKTYRWGGTVYVEIGSSLALGETSETAYAGDKGKRNADNIATLQSEKLSKATSPDGNTYFYAVRGTYNDQVTLIGTLKPSHNNQVPLTDGFGILHGRNQTNLADGEEVREDEFITKEYADKSYGAPISVESNAEDLPVSITLTDEQSTAIENQIANGHFNVNVTLNATGQKFLFNQAVTLAEGGVLYYAMAMISFSLFTATSIVMTYSKIEKTLTLSQQEPLFKNETSLRVIDNKVSLYSGDNDTGAPFGKSYSVAKINGNSILNDQDTVTVPPSYYAPETINTTAAPKVLTSKSGSFEWSDLSEAGTSVTIRRW